jgi:predicted transcriptional regulator
VARTQTIVQLTNDLVEALDAEAARRGVSRSALIRQALFEYLRAQSGQAIDRAIIEGYRRIPPGTPDGWADLDDLADASARETMQRLDAEERDAGLPPW